MVTGGAGRGADSNEIVDQCGMVAGNRPLTPPLHPRLPRHRADQPDPHQHRRPDPQGEEHAKRDIHARTLQGRAVASINLGFSTRSAVCRGGSGDALRAAEQQSESQTAQHGRCDPQDDGGQHLQLPLAQRPLIGRPKRGS